ncbi:MAG: aminoglycoside phosphotransferase family protein [Candidatus Uhrbacteria bacterium]
MTYKPEPEKEVHLDVVRDVVKEASGRDAKGINKIEEGFENEVYIVSTESGEDVVVRVRRKGDTEFRQESWAIEKSSEAGAPVAEVLLLKRVAHDGENLEVMVQEKLNGTPLENVKDDLSEQERDVILLKAGEAIAKIHSVSVEGSGQRKEDGSWEYPDWKSYMETFIATRREETDLLLDAGLTENEIQSALSALEQYRAYDDMDSVLCHGDFMPRHVMVDREKQEVGIIDFGLFRGNVPFFDLAYFQLNAPKEQIAPLLAGYEKRRKLGKDSERKLILAKLHLVVKHLAKLAHPYRKHRRDEIPHWLDVLRVTLAELE